LKRRRSPLAVATRERNARPSVRISEHVTDATEDETLGDEPVET
jgi:hypothetical protein